MVFVCAGLKVAVKRKAESRKQQWDDGARRSRDDGTTGEPDNETTKLRDDFAGKGLARTDRRDYDGGLGAGAGWAGVLVWCF